MSNLSDTLDLSTRTENQAKHNEQLQLRLKIMTFEVNTLKCIINDLRNKNEHLKKAHKQIVIAPPPPVTPPCPPPCPEKAPCDTALKKSREEYCQVRDNYTEIVEVVACMRKDNAALQSKLDKLQKLIKEETEKLKELLKKLEESQGCDDEKKKMNLQNQIAILKERIALNEEELCELKKLIPEKQEELEKARKRYKDIHEEIESVKRQIIILDNELTRVSEQGYREIEAIECEFTNRCEELSVLPEMIETVEAKIQDVADKHAIAEEEKASMDLETLLLRIDELLRRRQELLESDALQKYNELLEAYKILEELQKELVAELEKLTKLSKEYGKRIEMYIEKICFLRQQLEDIREDTASILAKIKDRAELVRKNLQSKIFELERDLSLNKVYVKGALDIRDEVKNRFKSEITELTERFSCAEDKVRNLSVYVDYFTRSYIRNLLLSSSEQANCDK